MRGVMQTIYFGEKCSILNEGTFGAKYKIEYNGKRDKFTLYYKRGANKFDVLTSSNEVSKILSIMGQYENMNSTIQFQKIKSKLDEVRKSNQSVFNNSIQPANVKFGEFRLKPLDKPKKSTWERWNQGYKAITQTDTEDNSERNSDSMPQVEIDATEAVENAQYYGFDKQPELSCRAIWRVIDGRLELRERRGKWGIISTGVADPIQAMNEYNGTKEYFYDAFNYPLDDKDASFALYKCIEYHNGLVVQLKKIKRTGEWKYDRLKINEMFKFTYFNDNLERYIRGEEEKFNPRYRLRRDTDSGSRQARLSVNAGESGWVDLDIFINGININNEIEAAWKWDSCTTYYDNAGNKCEKDQAIYRLVSPSEDYSRLYVKNNTNGWMVACIGSRYIAEKALNKMLNNTPVQRAQQNNNITEPVEIKNILEPEKINNTLEKNLINNLKETDGKVENLKPTKNIINTRETMGKFFDNVSPAKKLEHSETNDSHLVEKVYAKVKYSGRFTQDTLSRYLTLCIMRNRRIHKYPIINTRLLDMIGQPIYIYDYGYDREPTNINLNNIWLIESIEQAQSMCDDNTFESFPEPLQWSNTPYAYFWNPLIPLSPISSFTYELISEQLDVLHPSLRDKDISVIMSEIKHSCMEGERLAKIDVAFALPYYNSGNDTVSMMLPLKSKAISGDKVLNAMLFNRGLGYSLYKIITVDEAREAVMLFRDVTNTWLREEK